LVVDSPPHGSARASPRPDRGRVPHAIVQSPLGHLPLHHSIYLHGSARWHVGSTPSRLWTCSTTPRPRPGLLHTPPSTDPLERLSPHHGGARTNVGSTLSRFWTCLTAPRPGPGSARHRPLTHWSASHLTTGVHGRTWDRPFPDFGRVSLRPGRDRVPHATVH